MSDKYKLAIILGFFGLIAVAISGVAVIAAFRPDATATMLNAAIVLLGVASPFAVTFYMLQKQAAKLDRVEAQTNGTLSAKDAEITKLRKQLEKKGTP